MIRILYFIFLFLSLTNSGLAIGGFKLKYLLTLCLLLWTIIQDKQFFRNKLFLPYAIYLISFAICSEVTGNYSFFSQFFFAVFLPTFVGWRTTIVLMKQNNRFINTVCYVLLGLGAFDVIVTISQFFLNASWYEPIEAFFKFPSRESIFSDGNFLDDVIGVNTAGVFGSAVTNGLYLSTCSIISLYGLFKNKRNIYIILPIIFILGVFITQERANFAISAICVVVLVFLYLKTQATSKKIAYGILASLIIVFVGMKMIEYSTLYELRYSTLGTDNTGRDYIYQKTFEYLSANPMFPSFNDCLEYVGHAPHNIFLNAYLWGGPLGFAAIMYILFIQGKLALKIIREGVSNDNHTQYCFAFCWLVQFLISLVHNNCIVDGTLIVWVVWGALSYNSKLR